MNEMLSLGEILVGKSKWLWEVNVLHPLRRGIYSRGQIDLLGSVKHLLTLPQDVREAFCCRLERLPEQLMDAWLQLNHSRVHLLI